MSFCVQSWCCLRLIVVTDNVDSHCIKILVHSITLRMASKIFMKKLITISFYLKCFVDKYWKTKTFSFQKIKKMSNDYGKIKLSASFLTTMAHVQTWVLNYFKQLSWKYRTIDGDNWNSIELQRSFGSYSNSFITLAVIWLPILFERFPQLI